MEGEGTSTQTGEEGLAKMELRLLEGRPHPLSGRLPAAAPAPLSAPCAPLPLPQVVHMIAVLTYLGFVLPAVRQICDTLGIRCFSLAKAPAAAAPAVRPASAKRE
jgi:hypothetical protein